MIPEADEPTIMEVGILKIRIVQLLNVTKFGQ